MTEPAKPNICNVQEVFAKKLAIPDYQRPYKWRTKHIKQLVDDILSYFDMDKNAECRLGTVVLHLENKKYNIVDGQQRLVSLFLLLYCLHDGKPDFDKHDFLKEKFNHSQSVERIKENYDFIKAYLNNLDMDKSVFKEYILNHCTFAVVVLDKIDEAFQYFDSQNSRGKSLEAYDLLKAYHLREMVGDDSSAVHTAVEQWEQAITHPISLKLIINDILYRYREWDKFRSGEIFSKPKVDIFKGISHKDKTKYAKILMNRLSHLSMNMTMLDGIGFFDYIWHYRQLYSQLFDDGGLVNNDKITMPVKENKQQSEQQEPLYQTLQNNTARTGDFYLFTLFRIMVMAYYDKFGAYELKRAVIKIAEWVYCLRFKHGSIYFATIENASMRDLTFKDDEQRVYRSLYNVIRFADTPDEVLDFHIENIKETDKKFDNAPYLYAFIKDKFVEKSSSNNGEPS